MKGPGPRALGAALLLAACSGRSRAPAEAAPGASSDPTPHTVDASSAPPPVRFRSVASAEHAVCAVTHEGRLACWGDAAGLGLLGDGEPAPHASTTPLYVGDGTDWESVEAGPYAFCVRATGGRRACWGHLRQPGIPGLALPSSVVPAPLDTPLRVATLALGAYHACSLADDGEVRCWSDAPAGEAPAEGVPQVALPRAAALALGTHHTCVIDLEGAVFCLGSNLRGELARPRELASSAAPLPVGGDRAYRALSCAGARCCALASEAALWCWGEGAEPLFGVTATREGPDGLVRVALDDIPSAVAVLPDGVCTVLPEGDALCWDDGAQGQATRTPGLGRDALLVGGEGHRCALAQGELRCWGKAPREGVLGRGLATRQDALIALDGDFSQLSVTARGGCGVTSTGALRCWGRGDHLGRTPGGLERSLEVTLPAPVEAISLAYARAGEASHACAIAGSALYCWGRGESGQLGVAGLGESVTPVAVSLDGEPVRAVTTGVGSTCALGARGQLWCWGANDRGQLGQGDLTAGSSGPRAITWPAREGFVAVSVAGSRVSALRDDGSLWVWGDSAGGPASSTPSSLGQYGFASVLTTRGAETCALSQAGKLFCSVHDERGEHMAPVLPAVSFSRIDSSEEGVCGVDLAGAVQCALPRRSHGDHAASAHAHGGGWEAAPGYAGDPTLPLPREPVSALVGGSELRCALSTRGTRLCAGVWRGDNFAGDLDSEAALAVAAPR